MKIFCIGYNKTGTTSLSKALELLGYKALHDHHINREITDAASKGETHPAVEEYDAFLDFPEPEKFKALDEVYPGSKFILTVRDVDDWISSRLSHVLMNRRVPSRKSGWVEINTKSDRKNWQAHLKSVTDHFRGRKSDLLKYDICGGAKWKGLLEFLGKERPNKEFPCLHSMVDRTYLWEQIRQKPQLTTDWVSSRTESWSELLKDYMGQPDVHMLEIGCYQGRSTLWWLDNLLSHHTSRITCVDTWDMMKDSETFFDQNIAASGNSIRMRKFKMESWKLLSVLSPEERFDVIYVDGSHEAKDVLFDALMCLHLLKPGGYLIFDDYLWEGCRHFMPKASLDHFVEICSPYCEVVLKEYQLAVQKLEKEKSYGDSHKALVP